MTKEDHLLAARAWRLSEIQSRNYQGKLSIWQSFHNDNPLDAANRCALRAEFHENFVSPENMLNGYYNG